MNIQVYACGLLILGRLIFRCALGHGGVSVNKKEGDGVTPVGQFPLRKVLYRPDRGQVPYTHLGLSAISSDDGWCDDPAAKEYNQQIKLPISAMHEKLFRSDSLYDIVVPLGYNDDPPVPYLGSAIFLHLARQDYLPTEGCVAVARQDLLTIRSVIQPGAYLTVNPPPR